MYIHVCIYRETDRRVQTNTHYAFYPAWLLGISSFFRPGRSATQHITVRFLDSNQFPLCPFRPGELALNLTAVKCPPPLQTSEPEHKMRAVTGCALSSCRSSAQGRLQGWGQGGAAGTHCRPLGEGPRGATGGALPGSTDQAPLQGGPGAGAAKEQEGILQGWAVHPGEPPPLAGPWATLFVKQEGSCPQFRAVVLSPAGTLEHPRLPTPHQGRQNAGGWPQGAPCLSRASSDQPY